MKSSVAAATVLKSLVGGLKQSSLDMISLGTKPSSQNRSHSSRASTYSAVH
ncbi:hypothetical protein F441_01124 [Phytophthora nicotianae CJ01A1]|uniref:Uncharacterized protein n=6 Tax=Phytophthora nicotianae TaxID=4792 RepID=V9FXT7_PHYNI|nr:hypothetical protein PPTG_20817 [Phytophthora nicotianae INRA-310]XP_008891265.1 hypothetical protein PPTG_20818 [Phytophthora nicotianae INRA-310]ETI56304.1 hypothetical protein F443_01148 [Phytophthora nicotianae P1569]ETK96071.1 hypothetical protein L915_01088 [Phytophthora nicotianae]ETO85006.1 hypothetical protein F444_01157 [Phytophthora nicotianae P1976]ETP26106.1 hypothetical protein F441_01123 [Phytophthora nicotianae CJ01A1]ETP54097.1 hypothetical protein F442_01096 [Phytophthora